MSDEEAAAIEALDAAVHPPKPGADERPRQRNWAEPQWSVLIWDEHSQLVSHVGALTRLCLCDDQEVLIGGIGDVMTHPAQRRKGYAASGLRRALDFLKGDLRVDLSLLFCGPQMLNYYGRFGFRNFAGDTFVIRDGAKVLIPRSEVMVKPAMKPVPQCAALDLRGLSW